MADTNTGGGANVGRDASAGKDFTGRDRFSAGDGSSSSRVDVYTSDPRRHADEPTDADLLRGMQTAFQDIKDLKMALLGNPSNPRYQPGLVRTVEGLIDSVASIAIEQKKAEADRGNIRQKMSVDLAAQKEDILATQREALKKQMEGTNEKLIFLMSRTTIISIALIVIAVLLVGGAIFFSFRDFSEMPAAGMQGPHHTAEQTEATEGENAYLPVARDTQADTDNRDTVGGETGAVWVAGPAGIFPQPFSIFGPNVNIEQPAGKHT